ncbi:MAG: hypothetical protein HYR76_00050 [Ignavibacteria bacterium]|nr:hypothetical protein [Ignavibacteria bacterium]MBI3765456.1 hypothetical protein [Ignavibacteriales bacterium]
MKRFLIVLAAGSFLLGITAFAQAPKTSLPRSVSTSGGSTPDRVTKVGGFVSIPNKMSYQGLLTSPSGAPATDGSYDLKFEIFSISSGGSAIWTETQTGVSIQRGTFSVLLGSVTPLTAIFYQPLWVQVTATAGPGISVPITFTPRSELASSAYSLGPLVPTGTGNYYLPSGYLGVGAPPNNGFNFEVQGSFAEVLAKSSGGYAGFWADKSDAAENAYFVLRTAGLDEWSIGTQGDNNLTVFYWPAFSTYFKINTGDTVQVGNSTQTGAVHVFQDGSSSPVVRLSHHSASVGGQVRVYDDSSNMAVQIEADVNGRGGYLGVYKDIGSTAFAVDGNAFGTGEPRVDIYGNSRSVGFHMDQTGNASVVLPDSSISANEILDEPGISQGIQKTTTVDITGNTATMIDVVTTTLTIPTAGYIVVEASAQAGFSSTTSGNSMICQIDETSGGSYDINYEYNVGFGTASPSGSTWIPVSMRRTYYKAAGTYTFRFEALDNTGAGSKWFWNPVITASFFPTAYGSVSTIISPSTVSDFQNSSSMEVNGEQASGMNQTQAYKVDLRELELKVSKARLEAEKAERDLLNARLQQLKQDNQSPNDK